MSPLGVVKFFVTRKQRFYSARELFHVVSKIINRLVPT